MAEEGYLCWLYLQPVPSSPQVNSWTPVASMLSRRSSAGVAVLEGALYVAGGNDGTSCLNSVERYSPKAGAWESVAPMNIRRSASQVWVVGGGRLYRHNWLYPTRLAPGLRKLYLSPTPTASLDLPSGPPPTSLGQGPPQLLALPCSSPQPSHSQEHTRSGVHGWMAVCCGGQ